LMDINNHGDIVGTCEFDNKVYGYWAKSPLPHDDKVELPDPSNAPVFVPRNLIFITHGWNSNADAWPNELAEKFREELKKRGTLNEWDISVFDWEKVAEKPILLPGGEEPVFGPQGAVEDAIDAGKVWGAVFEKRKYKKVHLIAHSAGSWMIHEISKKINTEECEVRITFLDAFVPNYKKDGTKLLGQFSDTSEHYRDTRHPKRKITWSSYITVGQTGMILESADLEIDVSTYDKRAWSENPEVLLTSMTHAWPYHWYIQSFGTGMGADLSLAMQSVEK